MRTRDIMELIGGIGMGAAVMYLLDPQMGSRRRKYLAQQAGHLIEDAGDVIGDTWHTVSDRARDLAGDAGDYAEDAAEHVRGLRGRLTGRNWYGRRKGYAESARDLQDEAARYARSWGKGFPKQARSTASAVGHHLGSAGHYLADTARGIMPRRRRQKSYRDYVPHVYFGDRDEGASTTTLIVTAAGCALLGGALMYMLDPERGRRRRALVRDKMVRAGHATSDFARNTGRYATDKVRGTAAEARSMFRREQIPDQTLVERVRAEMGRAVSHPGSVQVTALNGRVTLRGPVLRNEVEDLLSRVKSVRGVDEVQNMLEIHETAGSVPGLQGQTDRPQRTQ